MVTRSLTRLGGAALDLIYPPRCVLCEKHGSFLCEACRESLPRADGCRCDACWLPLEARKCAACTEHPTALTRLRSVYRYEAGVRQVVQAFKFRGQSSLARELGVDMAACYQRGDFEAEVIVPVPLATSRKRSRGYNQALLLAKAVSRETGLPLTEALRRTGNASPQAQSASADERRRNVAGAFEIARPSDVAGRGVLLVDDVATTGATLNACAIELLEAGAASVEALSVARED